MEHIILKLGFCTVKTVAAVAVATATWPDLD